VNAAFQKLLEAVHGGLDFVLQHQKPTLIVFLITVRAVAIL